MENMRYPLGLPFELIELPVMVETAVTSCKLIDSAQLAKTETGAERCRCSKQNGTDAKDGIGRSEAVKPVGNSNRPSQAEYAG